MICKYFLIMMFLNEPELIFFFQVFLYNTTTVVSINHFCTHLNHHHHHHHHHVVQLARISLTLSLHVSLSFIASGRSSKLHPVPSQSCCMYVRAGRPAFDWPYAGVHRSTSLTISSLLLQQTHLNRYTYIICK